jgi:exonuclease III
MIRIVTYNCQNIKTSVDEVRELCRHHEIVFLQETWLLESQLTFLSGIDLNFHAKGISSMDLNSGILSGRPYGGLGILWSKKLGGLCKPVIYGNDSRLLGLELTINTVNYLFINTYMPHCCLENLDSYLETLSSIDGVIKCSSTPNVFVIGDFNADPNKKHLFGQELADYCHDCNLIISDLVFLRDCYTFFSCAHNTTSWLDHAVCTASAHQLITSCRVYHDKVSSDHFPLSISVDINYCQHSSGENICSQNYSSACRIHWDKVTEEQLHKFSQATENLLSNVHCNSSLSQCINPNCQLHEHISGINKLYDDICEALHLASKDLVVTSEHKTHQIPGWTEYCKDLHSEARGAFLFWRSRGSPKHGPFYHAMRITRAKFKLALRQCRSEKEAKNMDTLAQDFISKNTKSFWRGVRNNIGHGAQESTDSVEGATGAENICNMWYKVYKDLLNSSKDTAKKKHVLKRLTQISDCHSQFTPSDVETAIRNLKKNTSVGLDGISSEHLIFAHPVVYDCLCILFNCMLIHNFVPEKFMNTLLIPILKDNKCDNTVSDNYRPIAITCIISKVFELAILSKYRNVLDTNDHQFGYKRGHSTDQCIFIIKELIDFYMSSNSPLYVCYMDASKAFDRINYYRLFDKLLSRGIPVIIVRILYTWYTTQSYYIKWCNILSEPFKVSNGVRQGGNLSPFLFNIYIEELSFKLSDSKVGCFIANTCFNHIFYADDAVLLSPSPAGLQKLINICEAYGKCNEITYNTNKTVCMAFRPKFLMKYIVPPLRLYGNYLSLVDEHKYLGYYFTSDTSDVRDMKRQLRSIYCKGNILCRHFYKCCDIVKLQLFRSYCYNLFCAQLWTNYPISMYNTLKVAYNNVYRKLFGITKPCSMSATFVNNNIDSFYVLLRKSTVSFRQRLQNSQNTLLSTFRRTLFFLTQSKLYSEWSKRIF